MLGSRSSLSALDALAVRVVASNPRVRSIASPFDQLLGKVEELRTWLLHVLVGNQLHAHQRKTFRKCWNPILECHVERQSLATLKLGREAHAPIPGAGRRPSSPVQQLVTPTENASGPRGKRAHMLEGGRTALLELIPIVWIARCGKQMDAAVVWRGLGYGHP